MNGKHSEEKYDAYMARVPSATIESWWKDEDKPGKPRYCRILSPPEDAGMELVCWYTEPDAIPELTHAQRARMRQQEEELRIAYNAGEERVVDLLRNDARANEE